MACKMILQYSGRIFEEKLKQYEFFRMLKGGGNVLGDEERTAGRTVRNLIKLATIYAFLNYHLT